jgi:hypothetical protein
VIFDGNAGAHFHELAVGLYVPRSDRRFVFGILIVPRCRLFPWQAVEFAFKCPVANIDWSGGCLVRVLRPFAESSGGPFED